MASATASKKPDKTARGSDDAKDANGLPFCQRCRADHRPVGQRPEP